MMINDKAPTKQIINGTIVRFYSHIPPNMLKCFSTPKIETMYSDIMHHAVIEYLTPVTQGISEGFEDIAKATVRIETEIRRRGLSIMPLNSNEQASPIYATQLWYEYL